MASFSPEIEKTSVSEAGYRRAENAGRLPDMDLAGISAKTRQLSDLELATWLSLAAKEHCLLETEDGLVDDLSQEVALIASDVFKLSYAVLSVDDYGSGEDFVNAVLHQASGNLVDLGQAPERLGHDDLVALSPGAALGPLRGSNGQPTSSDILQILAPKEEPSNVSTPGKAKQKAEKDGLESRKLVNVIIAKDFNLAPDGIQIQGLELMRLRRVLSHVALHTAPGAFLFLPVISRSQTSPRLNKHLIDRIFISHYHDPEDGFANLEEMDTEARSDAQSSSSVLRKPSPLRGGHGRDPAGKVVSKEEISKLRLLSKSTSVSTEVRRYLHDIIVFLRQERGVAGGMSPHATTQFELLTKYLAPLHGLSYVTPSLVGLAAKKIYSHRVRLCAAEAERSMQYGSDLEAVRQALEGLTVDEVIESVLARVECPL